MSNEPEADERSWTCTCGTEYFFDDGPPHEGDTLECDECGATHEIEAVDWSAAVYFRESPTTSEEKP